MPEKYSCPKCSKELDEKYVINCTCPHCHAIFDKPTIQETPSPKEQEKEEPGETSKTAEEESEKSPSKTKSMVELLALFSLLIILLISYFAFNKAAANKKMSQETLRLATLKQQKEAENIQPTETLPAEKLPEPAAGLPLLIPQPQKEKEENREEEIRQAEKLQEAEERVAKAEKLQQETNKILEEMRLATQRGILQAEKLQEAEEKAKRAEKLQQDAEKALEEMRLAAQKETEKQKEIQQSDKLQGLKESLISAKKVQQESEKKLEEKRLAAQKESAGQFQYYYNKGETAFQASSYADALGFYQEALTRKPGDQKTQEKIRLTLAKLEYAQTIKQAEIRQKKRAEMVLIPAGQFLMGSHSGEGVNNEHPQRKVFLSAYYIDKYEVTVAQYRDFCRTTGRNMPTAPSWGWIETHPIVSVSWNDATAYANYYGNRLPTEAEWEKAVRAGSKTKYYFGDNEADLNDCAWYSVNSGNQTHPIGSKKPNPFGLYDMYGNAWEWCSDWYDPNYYTGGPKNDPPGPASGNLHSVRGGGWGYAADSCRSEVRNGLKPSYWDSCLGFRCAFSP